MRDLPEASNLPLEVSPPPEGEAAPAVEVPVEDEEAPPPEAPPPAATEEPPVNAL